jgi:hypothetical protein
MGGSLLVLGYGWQLACHRTLLGSCSHDQLQRLACKPVLDMLTPAWYYSQALLQVSGHYFSKDGVVWSATSTFPYGHEVSGLIFLVPLPYQPHVGDVYRRQHQDLLDG